jgi:hypothetical protein
VDDRQDMHRDNPFIPAVQFGKIVPVLVLLIVGRWTRTRSL